MEPLPSAPLSVRHVPSQYLPPAVDFVLARFSHAVTVAVASSPVAYVHTIMDGQKRARPTISVNTP